MSTGSELYLGLILVMFATFVITLGWTSTHWRK
jgi:hypothetical protein